MKQRGMRGALCTGALMGAALLAACGNGATGNRDATTDTPSTSEGGASEGGVTETGTPETSVGETGPEASTPDVIEDVAVAPDESVDVVDAAAPDESVDAPATPMDAPPDEAPDAPATPTDVVAEDTGGGAPGDGGTGDGSMMMPDAMINMCDPGTVMCPGGGTACVNTSNDIANCGMCGRACGAGEACVMGACACPTPRATCGGMCLDVLTDNANCGMCGRACPTGQSCNAGTCACPMGQTACGAGAAMTCSSTQSDPMNCGACGNACGAGQTCVMGACTCPTGQTRCGMGATSTCVTTASDNANCGACGTACTGGSSCSMGACTCPTGQTRCGMGTAAACTDTQTDTANCGTCGTACPSGQVCTMGVCRATCTAPNVACGTGAAMTCANTQNDDQNCGACGTVCGTVANALGGICSTGTCRPICTTGFANCNSMYADGCEVNTTTNLSNCGACGAACPVTAANATGVTCGSSRCVPTCNAPTATEDFRDCNSSVADGCERNVLNDPNNCGSCGNVCPTGGMCVAGRCASLNCRELHAAAPTLPSGIYPIDPDGTGPIAPFSTYCDMTTDGGGWTLVQRTVIDQTMSLMLLTDYATMRNTTLGSPTPGSFYRLAASNWRPLEVTGEHLVLEIPIRDDNTVCNPLYYKASGVFWNFPATGPAALTGTLAQSVPIFNQLTLSTTDTGPSTGCVNGSRAVPWTYTGCCSTCPTYKGGYWDTRPGRPMANYVAGSADINGRRLADVCAGGSGSPPQLSLGYYGFSEMGYFVR